MNPSVSIDNVVQEVDAAVMAGLRATINPMVALVKDAQTKYSVMEGILAGLPKHQALQAENARIRARLDELESNLKITVQFL